MDIESQVWLAEGRSGGKPIPATLSFNAQSQTLTLVSSGSMVIQGPINSIDKYIEFEHVGYKIKTSGKIYRLYFIDPSQALIDIGVNKIILLSKLRKTDYGKWGIIFHKHKVRNPWFRI